MDARAAPTPAAWSDTADVVIIGGGFYGCCLALYLRSVFDRVVVLEARDALLSRASFVNQARIHTGFHYPRSFVTARRSHALYARFMDDFRDAVVDDFAMLYAIARHGSKITPQRFEMMYRDMGAPIAQGTDSDRGLFNADLVADVFRCREFAFDSTRLKALLAARMEAAGISVVTGAQAMIAERTPVSTTLATPDGRRVTAPVVIDATYGQLAAAGGDAAPQVTFKYELTEIALITPPEALSGLGVTVMDGAFFSTMPFPARGAYSLTHVRYTPHRAWVSGQATARWPETAATSSHWLHMQRDAARFMPCLAQSHWQGSLYEVKTVLLRNERDDGRPILLTRHPETRGLMTVLGGKLDNIYDLFEALKAQGGAFKAAHEGYVTGRGA